MRKHPMVFALSIAGIIAGTHAGIAAISSDSTVVTVADPAAIEAALPAPLAAAETPAPAEASPVAEAAQVQTQVPLVPSVQVPVESMVQPKWVPKWVLKPAAETQRVAARASDDEYYLRIPFTNRQIKVTSTTFPRYSSEYPDPSPAVVAYFDRKNANTVLVGAPGPVFPGGSGDDAHQVSPATVAYFEQLEARRLAAINAATPAVAVAPSPALTPDAVVSVLSSTTAPTVAPPIN